MIELNSKYSVPNYMFNSFTPLSLFNILIRTFPNFQVVSLHLWKKITPHVGYSLSQDGAIQFARKELGSCQCQLRFLISVYGRLNCHILVG